MATVFISYSSKDASEARRLSRELTRNGIKSWIDEYEILPGDSITQKISEGLNQSDHLIVLLSRSSTQSHWVKSEIQAIISRNHDASAIRIIPVKIDDVEVPAFLEGFNYVDLRDDYQLGINRLVAAIKNKRVEEVSKISDLIKPEDLSKHIEEKQKEFKGSGHLITTILGILTLILTVVTAIPSFYSAFSNTPKIYYSVANQKILIPASIEETKIKKLLKDNDISEATLKIDIVNSGDVQAKSVKVGVTSPGEIELIKTDPPANPTPIWVKIKIDHDPKKVPENAIFSFNELIPTKKISVLIGYHIDKSNTEPIVDVIYDGRPATMTDNVDSVPMWSWWQAFQIPIKVFGFGLLFTVLIGSVVVIRNNPKLREAFLLILKELNPTIANITDMLLKIK